MLDPHSERLPSWSEDQDLCATHRTLTANSGMSARTRLLYAREHLGVVLREFDKMSEKLRLDSIGKLDNEDQLAQAAELELKRISREAATKPKPFPSLKRLSPFVDLLVFGFVSFYAGRHFSRTWGRRPQRGEAELCDSS